MPYSDPIAGDNLPLTDSLYSTVKYIFACITPCCSVMQHGFNAIQQVFVSYFPYNFNSS